MSSINSEKCIRLALYQESFPDNIVKCHLCPHECKLHDGQNGICHARINRQGTLYTIAYGNPCSLVIDPIEKKPLFHFYPGSKIFSLAVAGCNFRCLNCQNFEISQNFPDAMQQYVLMPDEIVKQALRNHVSSIAFTYTEPTIFYEYMYDIAKLAHQKGIKTVMISNGYINRQPLLDLCPFLDAANIDLKCFDEMAHLKLTGGHLQPVLNTLKTLQEQGVWLEITNLLIPDISDKPEIIQGMCEWLVNNGFSGTPLHFSRFFPMYKLAQSRPTPEYSLLLARDVAEAAGMKFVYIGNIPGLNGENTFCPHCKHLLVERLGYAVKQNAIQNGSCKYCGKSVPGVW